MSHKIYIRKRGKGEMYQGILKNMENDLDLFGINVFNDEAMQKYLPKSVFDKFKKCIDEGICIDSRLASDVAVGMKKWAMDKGATHFTHWFQPMTGLTAEKHDSFLSIDSLGNVEYEFSGNELIHGEPDASSFPSGGLRATFEARGYTAWDPTSPAFLKDGVLCIPTAFCSYSGDALDKKTPLLRSMEAIDEQSKRILRLFGRSDVKSVKTMVGAEQEYFLIDKRVFDSRCDLVFCGRTLFGAKPPKGQELDDHYFGSIKPRVAEFMKELNRELWKLGIKAKTQHNEVAPAQHELAPIFDTANISCDGNQLTMELMQKIAAKHGLACLLHDKPFEGINGSGKHNNWSLMTDTGINLFDPGDTPYDNAQFLLFLTAVVKAVDENQDLLRISVSTASNDHRLGGNEAPPAIVSVFLGEELTEILNCIASDIPYGKKEKEIIKIGVSTLPYFTKDSTDRNRTSPFAFTGNKFEFRMPGASQSVSCANTFINTAVADALCEYASVLESSSNFNKALHELIKNEFSKHKRIVFNGNGYGEEWIEEAKKRGLSVYATSVEALARYPSSKNVALFERHGVLNESEIKSRTEILLDNYVKVINIEALTMISMTRKSFLPSISAFSKSLAETITAKKQYGADTSYERTTLRELSVLSDMAYSTVDRLETQVAVAKGKKDSLSYAEYMRDNVIPLMTSLRNTIDEAENKTAKDYWPYNTYEEILFSVK